MTIAYIDVAKAPVQVPVIDLLQEPQGAAFDFISGQAWIVDKVNPANTMLRNIGDVLTNPGASATKLLRRQSGLIEAAPWWSNEYAANGQPMGMRVEAQRTRINRYPTQIENAAWQKVNVDVVQVDGQPGLSSGNVRKVVASAIEGVHQIALPCTLLDTVPIYAYTAIVEYDGTPYACVYENVTSSSASNRFGVQIDMQTGAIVAQSASGNVLPPIVSDCGPKRWAVTIFFAGKATTTRTAAVMLCNNILVAGGGGSLAGDTYTGDALSGVKVWHAQVEPNPFPSSPILGDETAAAGGTRAADQPQIPIGFLPFNMAAGTMIWKGMAFDYDGGGQALGQPALRFYRNSTQYAFIAKSDVTARNSQAAFTVRAANAVGVEDSQALSFPVSSPSILAMSWDEQSVIGVSGRTGTNLQSPTGPGPIFDPLRLEFLYANGVAWHQFGIFIPRKLSAPDLLQRTRL